MNQEPAANERELSILNLAALAARRWKTLLAVGVAAAVVAAITLSVTPPSYEATSKILVMRTRSKTEMVGLDRTVIEPDYFAAALEGDEILLDTLSVSGLDAEPYEFDLDRMRGAVSVTPLRNENSIEIRVKLPSVDGNQTPKLVAEVANHLASKADEMSQEILKEDIERSRKLFDQEYERVEERLEEVRREYQDVFLTAPLLEKEKEIENLHFYQRNIQTSLSLAIADFEQKAPKLAVLDGLLADEDRLLNLSRELEEEPSLLPLYAEATGKSATELYSATSNTQIANEVYVNLRDLRDTIQADVVGLENAIPILENNVEDCNGQIRAAELVYNASKEAVDYWTDVLETAKLTHRAVDERHKTTVLSIISDRQDLISLSPALAPTKPSGVPRSILVVITPLLAMTIFLAALFIVEVVRVSIRV